MFHVLLLFYHVYVPEVVEILQALLDRYGAPYGSRRMRVFVR